MDKFEVVPTEKLEATASFVRNAIPHLTDSESCSVYLRKSAGELPQFIYFLAPIGVVIGLGLTEFARAFCAKLGSSTAQKLVETLQKQKKSNDENSLVALAQTMADAKSASSQEFDLIFKIEINDHVELSMPIQSSHAAGIADEISHYFAALESIAENLNAELEDAEFGKIFAFAKRSTDGGVLVEWHAKKSLKAIHFPPAPTQQLD